MKPGTQVVRAGIPEAEQGEPILPGPVFAAVYHMRGDPASTPFGYGRPYSLRQLSALLRETMFQPRQRAGALWTPPLNSRLLLRTASVWEGLGPRLAPQFAGLLIQEADKQIYAAAPVRAFKPARARRRAPAGAATA